MTQADANQQLVAQAAICLFAVIAIVYFWARTRRVERERRALFKDSQTIE